MIARNLYTTVYVVNPAEESGQRLLGFLNHYMYQQAPVRNGVVLDVSDSLDEGTCRHRAGIGPLAGGGRAHRVSVGGLSLGQAGRLPAQHTEPDAKYMSLYLTRAYLYLSSRNSRLGPAFIHTVRLRPLSSLIRCALLCEGLTGGRGARWGE